MRSWRDVRLAVRGFAKNPGFTLLAILAVALGIGAATIIFSLVDSIALNPFPFIDSQRLMFIQIHDLQAACPAADMVSARRSSRNLLKNASRLLR